MADWYYGYATKNGLEYIKVDPENITVDLFYASEVKSEISDEKTIDLWKIVNKAFMNKSEKGIVFRVQLPSEEEFKKTEELMKTSPKEALIFMDSVATGVEVNINGTTAEEAEKDWNIITGRVSVELEQTSI